MAGGAEDGSKGNNDGGSDAHHETVLHVAARAGASNVVAFCMARGANVNCETRFGETPLLMACSCGQHDAANDMVRLMIRGGANQEARTALGDGAVQVAQRAGNTDVVMLLSGGGASLRASTGTRPL